MKRAEPVIVKLRCPVCGYEYETSMSGWAFRTSSKTKCIGKEVVQDGSVATMHTYNHPFERIEE